MQLSSSHQGSFYASAFQPVAFHCMHAPIRHPPTHPLPAVVLQTKCVRYYMNFDRALALMRSILDKEGHAFDADNKEGEESK